MAGPKSVFDPPARSPEFVAPPARTAAARTRKPNAHTKRGKFRLSAACSEVMSDEEFAWWLREVMAGRDPDAPRDEAGNIKPSVDGYVRQPEWKDRLKAAEMFANRKYGTPVQQVVLEAELQVQGRLEHAALGRPQIRQMDPTKKAELRALLGQALRGDLALPRGVIPVEAAEARDANPAPEG